MRSDLSGDLPHFLGQELRRARQGTQLRRVDLAEDAGPPWDARMIQFAEQGSIGERTIDEVEALVAAFAAAAGVTPRDIWTEALLRWNGVRRPEDQARL